MKGKAFIMLVKQGFYGGQAKNHGTQEGRVKFAKIDRLTVNRYRKGPVGSEGFH